MIGATALGLVLSLGVQPAWAVPSGEAAAFVQNTCDRLTAIANSEAAPRDMRPRFLAVLDATVDIEATARFCLGRFWRGATAEQQQEFTAQFRELLVTKIANHLGKHRGVRVTVGPTHAREGSEVVVTTIDRPGTPTSQIDWVVTAAAGEPKVIDLLSEGVSMRLTQHSDFTSYLSRNSIDALIGVMRKRNEQTG